MLVAYEPTASGRMLLPDLHTLAIRQGLMDSGREIHLISLVTHGFMLTWKGETDTVDQAIEVCDRILAEGSINLKLWAEEEDELLDRSDSELGIVAKFCHPSPFLVVPPLGESARAEALTSNIGFLDGE